MVGRELTDKPEARKLGLIVNPIAGMGGRVGLKGTDGQEILARALRLGAQPVASKQASKALRALSKLLPSAQIRTVLGEMGEQAARDANVAYRIVAQPASGKTTAEDTKMATKVLRDSQVALILFAGGDGTASDIFHAIGDSVPVLGIPAGVKMFSGVFAISAEAAGRTAADFLQEKTSTMAAEVLDFNEDDYRRGILSPRLVGGLRVPASPQFVQSGKQTTVLADDESRALESIARYLLEESPRDCNWILGPGSTVAAISRILGAKKNLLSVDVLKQPRELTEDVNESQLLGLSRREPCMILVSPIGRQGFLFGRGNQQISARVLRQVGLKNVRIVATRSKLSSIEGRRLLVDTEDAELDATLKGFVRVIVGYREEVILPVE